jgi:P-type Ca2+ transporter type 2C
MLTDQDIQSVHGLTAEVVSDRLKHDGWNELPSSKPKNFFRIALDVLKEPILLLLLACGTVYLIIGDRQEALILLSFVFLIIGIELFQEQKTERAMEALRDLSSPRALVIRDGKHERIAGRSVVRGDMVILAEGDRVPADASLVWATSVQTD